jgi:hypothetical protein
MSKGKKKKEIYGSDIREGVLHEGGSLNGWKLPTTQQHHNTNNLPNN